MREARRESDDAARPPPDHAGDHCLVAPHDAVEIDPQDAIPLRRIHVANRRPGLNGRSANETVDPAELALDAPKRGEHRGAIGHIEVPDGNAGNAG